MGVHLIVIKYSDFFLKTTFGLFVRLFRNAFSTFQKIFHTSLYKILRHAHTHAHKHAHTHTEYRHTHTMSFGLSESLEDRLHL